MLGSVDRPGDHTGQRSDRREVRERHVGRQDVDPELFRHGFEDLEEGDRVDFGGLADENRVGVDRDIAGGSGNRLREADQLVEKVLTGRFVHRRNASGRAVRGAVRSSGIFVAVTHQLAQLNIGVLNQPLDHRESAEFVAALDPINALAEATPGFVWRLQGEDGSSSSYVELPDNDDPLLIVNYSIWADVESLHHFMFKSGHAVYLRRRREWFAASSEATSVCWWIPAGTIPELAEAYARLLRLRSDGPTADAFPHNRPFPAPAEPA